MPADILGTNIIVEDADGRKHFQFQQGPIFAHVLLADEINRATPKTQSALLEAMQEPSVTVGGLPRPLPAPFFVLATQNPIEMEGTYPLPEAQLDRFLFKLRVRYPAVEELNAIIDRTTQATTGQRAPGHERGRRCCRHRELVREVPIASHVRDFASAVVMATHPQWEHAPEVSRRFVRYGASPRGAQAMVLAAKVRALADGPLQRERGRPEGRGGPCASPSHHPELRGRGRGDRRRPSRRPGHGECRGGVDGRQGSLPALRGMR